MNRKLIKSAAVIGVALGIIGGATLAYFNDTEEVADNTITAGTIDISVNGENPVSTTSAVAIDDMKPSYVRWTQHVVRNVGTNPLRLWKHIKDISVDENEISEPEQEWYDENNDSVPKNDIDTVIEYDMYLDGTVDGEPGDNYLGGVHSGGTVVIDEDDGITLADIESAYIYLGTLNPDTEVVVWQSYHMKDETENWAQTDRLTYTIEFYAEQVNGPGPTSHTLLLENKDGNWNPITGDGVWGILKWAGDGTTFDFSTTLTAHGLMPSTEYSLIYYADPWPGNNPGALIGTASSDADGDLTMADNPDLGMDLPDPADANYPTGAKIWLVPSSDYSAPSMTAWNPDQYLFEYNLIKYDDTDF